MEIEGKGGAAIEFLDFETRRVTRVAALEKPTLMGMSNLAISPDGRWLLYTEVAGGGSDIVMVENFR